MTYHSPAAPCHRLTVKCFPVIPKFCPNGIQQVVYSETRTREILKLVWGGRFRG
jgi:hypothetical protein